MMFQIIIYIFNFFLREKSITKTLTLTQEIVRFKTLLRSDRDLKFEEFWSTNCKLIPILCKFVLEYNIMCSTSVPSESSFSIGGILQSKQRASMSPETLQYSMFLKSATTLFSNLKINEINEIDEE